MPAPAVRSRSARSCSRTRQPRCASAHAAVRPAKPPPTISAHRVICRRIPNMTIDERLARFARRQSKGISYRETRAGQALVFLHGIGSSSAGWLCPLETLGGYRLIAWDAPGYGESEFLAPPQPRPADYAQALHEFLDRLLLKDVVLVGNSLGCLMAGGYGAAHPERVRSMVLLGPAAGYGDLPDKDQKLRGRLEQLEKLGAEGMARERSPTLVAKGSPPFAL